METLEQAICSVSRIPFSYLPTPLARLSNLEQKLNCGPLYVKRDDLTGLGPGGNKLRSLEFLVGDAVDHGADTLVASGPLQSNLCTLTAAACAKLGLHCVLVHNGEEPEHPTGNVLLNRLLGAECHYLGNVSAEKRQEYVDQLERELSARCKPYVVRNGATTGRGALGYVNAVLELVRQTKQLGISDMTIFAPGGNGGVASGLIYGNALCKFPFHVVIISVENEKETLCADIQRTIEETAEILNLAFPVPLEQACIVDDGYRGDGWGMNTQESSQAIPDFARTEGIILENIYNSKVLVGMMDYLKRGAVSGPACYLHTGGFGSLFAQY